MTAAISRFIVYQQLEPRNISRNKFVEEWEPNLAEVGVLYATSGPDAIAKAKEMPVFKRARWKTLARSPIVQALKQELQ